MPSSSNLRRSSAAGEVKHYPHPHRGPHVLPNTPFLYQLLRHAHYRGRLALRDVNLGIEKTYTEILSDALHFRVVLRKRLPADTRARLDSDDGSGNSDTFIGILAPGGYEYVVAVLAAIALGAVVVPMSPTVPVEEAAYFVTKSQQAAIVSSQSSQELGESIAAHVRNTGGADSGLASASGIQSIPVLPQLRGKPPIAAKDMDISAGLYLSDDAAGVVIFTSGTSGPPKGCVIRRGYITDASRAVAEHFALSPSDVSLHLLPVHHISGLAINILPFLVAGACVEFRSGGFDAKWTWERWRRGGLTIFSGVPTIYMRMMRHHQAQLAGLPEKQRKEYEAGARQFRAMLCGTSALPRPVADFWTELRGGRQILTRYGSTEVGAVLRVPLDRGDTPDGSVGVVSPGVDLKLVPQDEDGTQSSDGSAQDADANADTEEGEIRVKSPELFSRYLHDAENTAASFDPEGFFMTGDIARREGDYYYIVGRASQDIIKSGGYKISALDIEREILALPYISEIMVCGADDLEFGQRVAAVVTLREDQTQYSATDDGKAKKLTLDALRDDLRQSLSNYKLPTLLKVISGDLPKTASGKVLKKVLGPEIFPPGKWDKDPSVQVWRSKASKL